MEQSLQLCTMEASILDMVTRQGNENILREINSVWTSEMAFNKSWCEKQQC